MDIKKKQERCMKFLRDTGYFNQSNGTVKFHNYDIPDYMFGEIDIYDTVYINGKLVQQGVNVGGTWNEYI